MPATDTPAAAPKASRHLVVWSLVACAVFLGLLFLILPQSRFADDFLLLHDRPAPGFFAYLTQHHPFSSAYYRPLMLVFTHAVQYLWGTAVWPINLVHLLLHLGLGLLVYRAARDLALPRGAALGAALWTLTAQIVVHPLYSLDTFPHLAMTLAGWGAVYLLYRALWKSPPGAPRIGRVAGAALLFFAALLCRENALGFLGAVTVVIACYAFKDRQNRRVLWFLLPFAALTVAYFLLRVEATSDAAVGTFLNLSLRQLLNPLLLLGAVLTPLPSDQLIMALRRGDWPIFGGGLLILLALLALIVLGLRRNGRHRLVWVMIALLACSMVPHFLLNHISELYAYNSLPVFAILAALGLYTLYRKSSTNRRRLLTGLLGLLMAVNLYGVVHKTALLSRNGRDARHLLQQLEPYQRQLEPGGTLYLLNPAYTKPYYSVFHLNGFWLLNYFVPHYPAVPRDYTRHLWIGNADQLYRLATGPDDTLLTLEPDSLTVTPWEDAGP